MKERIREQLQQRKEKLLERYYALENKMVATAGKHEKSLDKTNDKIHEIDELLLP